MNLLNLWNSIECYLFPHLEDLLSTDLSKKEREFVRVCTLSELERHTFDLEWQGLGRKSKDRLSILKAFIAKAVYNLDTTRSLINYLESSPTLRRLCGWEYKRNIPHESKFSRVFALIAEHKLCQRIHRAMIKAHCERRIIGHLSRDSTAIEAREKVTILKENKVKTPQKRGRPKNGEVRIKAKTVVEQQVDRSLEENIANLSTHCNRGTKKNSNGYKISWKGYKLHLDCIDGDIPTTAILTSASVHDSQVAIPLAQMSSQRFHSLYDLMDAAYDSPSIHQFSQKLGHRPIIDHNPRRGGQKRTFEPLDKLRYNERSSAERVNSYLKDNYGGRNVRVKGHLKVMSHLMFGIIAITANQLFKLL
tara:strand:- start:190 stop:1278 length:1089 start_codon:yes stop_codon:yes gene_type:complete